MNSSYILLVDDEPMNLILLEHLLEPEGYETFAADSGAQALATAKQVRPSLILLDVMMPEMDGFEVCRQLRADPDLQSVPIIFLTALSDDESRLKGLGLMGDDYLTKPISNSLVLAKVANTLRLTQMRATEFRVEIREQAQRQVNAAWNISESLLEKFRLFVPDQLLNRIAPKGVESIQLGNAIEAEVTALFCDIRGFTSIVETQPAADTFEWLNAFFSRMNQVITDNGGFIDKFMGDALMAVFDRPHHAQNALTAALSMQQTLTEFNRTYEQYNLQQPLKVGIGIHTGTAVMGTIGSDRRMDSTVIGDVINTASRLEELTKLYKCPILASDRVIAEIKHPEAFQLRWVDRIAPRGKQQEYDLYEVLGAYPDFVLDAPLVKDLETLI